MRRKVREAEVFKADCEWNAKRVTFLMNLIEETKAGTDECWELLQIVKRQGMSLHDLFAPTESVHDKGKKPYVYYVRRDKVVVAIVEEEIEVARA